MKNKSTLSQEELARLRHEEASAYIDECVDEEKSNKYAAMLEHHLNSNSLDILYCTKFIIFMIITNAFEKNGFEDPYVWFEEKMGNNHCSRDFFFKFLQAASASIQLRIEPFPNNYNMLLAISTVPVNQRLAVFNLAQAKSNLKIPDEKTVLEIIYEYE